MGICAEKSHRGRLTTMILNGRVESETQVISYATVSYVHESSFQGLDDQIKIPH